MVIANHGIGGYRSGCRCDTCKQAESVRKAKYYARKRGLEPVPDLVPMRGTVPEADARSDRTVPEADVPSDRTVPEADVPSDRPGRVAAAVLAELETLPAAGSRPGLAAGAMAMAELIDDKRLSPTHPSAMRQLSSALATLRAGSAPVRGKLAQVISMSNAPKPS